MRSPLCSTQPVVREIHNDILRKGGISIPPSEQTKINPIQSSQAAKEGG